MYGPTRACAHINARRGITFTASTTVLQCAMSVPKTTHVNPAKQPPTAPRHAAWVCMCHSALRVLVSRIKCARPARPNPWEPRGPACVTSPAAQAGTTTAPPSSALCVPNQCVLLVRMPPRAAGRKIQRARRAPTSPGTDCFLGPTRHHHHQAVVFSAQERAIITT